MANPVDVEPHSGAVVAKLALLDRFLPVWIGIAMALGLLLGRLVPGLDSALDRVQVDGISLPFVILTTALMPFCIIASWKSVTMRSVAARIADGLSKAASAATAPSAKRRAASRQDWPLRRSPVAGGRGPG